MFRINDSIKFQGANYTISEFLGQGGMGHVFLVKESSSNLEFALKSLQYYLPDDNNHHSLINEWEKAQTITHENVIKYYGFHDGLSSPNTPFLIMELANEGSLGDFLKKQQSLLSEDICLGIFHQIINGMEAVNEVLIHRDIKPDNIFISNEKFKIADFGLAKIAQEKTRSRTFKGWGTEPYIAPEAYRLETNTIQMDMYSIGHVFYQIAALRHAFGLQDNWEQAHLTTVPEPLNKVNPNISPKIASVVYKLMAKKPSDRYENWNCVRAEMAKSTKSAGSHKSAINNILQKKVSRDVEAERLASEESSRKAELKRKSDILDFQFNNNFIRPIKEFVENFNDISGESSSMRMYERASGKDDGYEIRFDGDTVNIWFHKIGESDFRKGYENTPWGDKRPYAIEPNVNGKPVLAWGGISSSDGKGLNILLLTSYSDEYGDWYLLKNTHSGFSPNRENRPDPFAFNNDELIKEIHHIGATHIYNLNLKELDFKDVINFISDSF